MTPLSTQELYRQAIDHLNAQVRDARDAFEKIATGKVRKPVPRKRTRKKRSPRQMGYSAL